MVFYEVKRKAVTVFNELWIKHLVFQQYRINHFNRDINVTSTYEDPNSVTLQLAQGLKSTLAAKMRTLGPSRMILLVLCIFVLGCSTTGHAAIITE